jgi:hypothetical protein
MGKSCDDGFQERWRKITRRSNGGKECPKLKERRKCFLGNACKDMKDMKKNRVFN